MLDGFFRGIVKPLMDGHLASPIYAVDPKQLVRGVEKYQFTSTITAPSILDAVITADQPLCREEAQNRSSWRRMLSHERVPSLGAALLDMGPVIKALIRQPTPFGVVTNSTNAGLHIALIRWCILTDYVSFYRSGMSFEHLLHIAKFGTEGARRTALFDVLATDKMAFSLPWVQQRYQQALIRNDREFLRRFTKKSHRYSINPGNMPV
jgi:hypothetical protein